MSWRGTLHGPCTLNTGVPQGSVPGHMLFTRLNMDKAESLFLHREDFPLTDLPIPIDTRHCLPSQTAKNPREKKLIPEMLLIS